MTLNPENKQISIIVAVAENHAIGKDNQLLWHIPEDLKRFKRITMGCPVVMGRNTYESLPVRPLPGRRNIVISDNPADDFDGCEMSHSIEDAIEKCETGKENFIMGGASVYRQFLDIAQKLYITRVHAVFEADTFFPDISLDVWELIEYEHHCQPGGAGYSYSFLTYLRK